MSRRGLLALVLVFEGAVLFLAIAFGAAVGPSLAGRARWSPAGILVGGLAGVALYAAARGAMRSTWPPLEHLGEALREIVCRYFARATPLDVAVVSALAGLAEEALFRGVLQTGLVAAWGTAPGIAVASALFGLAHPISPIYGATAAGMGAILGALFVASGDLAAPVLAHTLYDFLVLRWILAMR